MEPQATPPETLLKQLADYQVLLSLFDYLPDAYFYVKDRHSRFVTMNRSLLQLRGARSAVEVIGQTDFDLHPVHWAQQYIDEDRRVMDSGVAVINQAWLVPDQTGRLLWFLSTKVPLKNAQQKVIGLAGVMRDFEKTEQLARPYQQLEQVLAYVTQHYGERITVTHLAKLAKLSVSQLDRRFKAVFQMTPQQYVTRVRIHEATRRLMESDASIGDIAFATGFYDQAHFTRAFQSLMHCTPTQRRASKPVTDAVKL